MGAFVEIIGRGPGDAARIGGKAASLSRLIQLGHRVPPGIAVTVDAFSAALERLGLLEAHRALARAPVTAGDDLHRELCRAHIPDEVLRPIVAAIDELDLWGHGGRLIVRSSATVEDGASASFAGIFESIPIDGPGALEKAILEVWASSFSARALAYARSRGITGVPVMPIVIQQFLEAERSGVMFTRFTKPTGEERVLVEHVEGGCEKLVRGEVTPDRLWLADDETEPDGGALGHAHALGLLRVARALEASFGAPQDVEWLVFRDQLHLVQSRPITTHASAPKPTASNVAERADEAVLSGIPASPGVASGKVHLVFNIEQALAITRGEVLVTPMTNPDMVVAMRNAVAIVTDVGGMICHAAIVSRELGVPCVVGTEHATTVLVRGEDVTVDGSRGAIHRGLVAVEAPIGDRREMTWSDLWSAWARSEAGSSGVVPRASTLRALEAAPSGTPVVELVPDLDLRADARGLWHDLEARPEDERRSIFEAWVARVAHVARTRGIGRVRVRPGDATSTEAMALAVSRAGEGLVAMADASTEGTCPLARAAVGPRRASRPTEVGPPRVDVGRFFGHKPRLRRARLPDPAWRARWRALLPAHDAFHRDFHTAEDRAEHHWLELRPEIVISPLLASTVLPGFEMIPRTLGFSDIPPMHLKWIRCRYHMREDVFLRVWDAVVRATWDRAFLADMLARVRSNYQALVAAADALPRDQAELGSLSGSELAAHVLRWWPIFVEFFSLNWFEQAQGDDILAPYLEEVLADELDGVTPPEGIAWPNIEALVAPTTPVMSADYISDVDALRDALLAAGLSTRALAEAALARGEHPEIAARLERHLARWGWMRDRDLLHRPWDTAARVIDTALATEPHAPLDYAKIFERHLLALSFLYDLADGSTRAGRVHHAARFLQDLRLERENHHIRWLQCSHAYRRLVLEVERRLVELGSLVPGEIFFLHLPELLDAARALPAPLAPELVQRVKNRRSGYLLESKFPNPDLPPPVEEDDYY